MPRKIRPRRWPGPKVYAKSDGAVLWCRFTIDGQLIRRSTGEVDSAKAQTAARAIWLGDLERAGKPSPDAGGDVDLRELVAEYLAWRTREGKGAPGYISKLEESYDHYLLSRFSKLGEITKDRWTQVTRELRDGGTSWSTIARQTTYLSVLLKWAHAQGKLPTLPKLSLPDSKTIRRTQKKRRALSMEERDALLANLKGESKRWYVVAFWTAMRMEEINRMTLRWIDFEQESITIPASDQKSGEEEPAIHMPSQASRAIKEQIAARGNIGRGAPIFGATNHYRSWWTAVKRAGIDTHGLTAHHTARHTCLSELGAHGGPTALLAVMAQARHKDPKTSQKYVHTGVHLAKMAREAAEARKTAQATAAASVEAARGERNRR
jgi:integrase